MTTPQHDEERAVKELVRRLKHHCKGLNDVLKDARKIHPKACLYLAGSLHLMSGHHHDDASNSSERGNSVAARQDRIIGSANLNADGGDW